MPPRRPEILAPAGDLDSLRAALASGADSVYFGLDEGFNARARAENFSLARLPKVVALIHRAGARAYVTLNTLVFEPELPVIADVGCRNTVFNAQAQSAASLVPRLLERGVRRFRVLGAYQELLAGRIPPAEAVRRASAHEQFGVTRGTMKVLGAV
jgi:collagenase-like PrtC family protease